MWPMRPQMEEVLMMAPPPCFRITGRTYLVARKTLAVLTSIIFIHSSFTISSMGLRMLMPALFTTTSSRPLSETMRSTMVFHSSSLVTSATAPWALPP